MDSRQLSQTIRAELKAHGYSSKDVGVSVKDCGYSIGVFIKIKSPKINQTQIEAIVKPYEEIDWDTRTHEALKGGNTYIFIDYLEGVFKDVIKPYEELAERIFNRVSDRIETIADGLYFINTTEHKTLRQQNNKGSYNITIRDIDQLSKLLFKFDTFDSIEA